MRLTIGRKIAAVGGAGILGVAVVGVVSFGLVGSMRDQTTQSAQLSEARAQACIVERELSDLAGVQKAALLATNDAHRAAAQQQLAAVQADLAATWKDIDGLDLPPEVRSRLVELRTQVDAYAVTTTKDLPILLGTDPSSPKAQALIDDLTTGEEQVVALDEDVTADITKTARAEAVTTERTGREVQISGGGRRADLAAAAVRARDLGGPIHHPPARRMVAALQPGRRQGPHRRDRDQRP